MPLGQIGRIDTADLTCNFGLDFFVDLNQGWPSYNQSGYNEPRTEFTPIAIPDTPSPASIVAGGPQSKELLDLQGQIQVQLSLERLRSDEKLRKVKEQFNQQLLEMTQQRPGIRDDPVVRDDPAVQPAVVRQSQQKAKKRKGEKQRLKAQVQLLRAKDEPTPVAVWDQKASEDEPTTKQVQGPPGVPPRQPSNTPEDYKSPTHEAKERKLNDEELSAAWLAGAGSLQLQDATLQLLGSREQAQALREELSEEAEDGPPRGPPRGPPWLALQEALLEATKEARRLRLALQEERRLRMGLREALQAKAEEICTLKQHVAHIEMKAQIAEDENMELKAKSTETEETIRMLREELSTSKAEAWDQHIAEEICTLKQDLAHIEMKAQIPADENMELKAKSTETEETVRMLQEELSTSKAEAPEACCAGAAQPGEETYLPLKLQAEDECYVKALESSILKCYVKYAQAWKNFAIGGGGTVDGKFYTKEECLQKHKDLTEVPEDPFSVGAMVAM